MPNALVDCKWKTKISQKQKLKEIYLHVLFYTFFETFKISAMVSKNILLYRGQPRPGKLTDPDYKKIMISRDDLYQSEN